MKKFRLFILCLLCCAVATFSVRAENFYIENYEVMLNVSQTRKVHVKEVITVHFTAPSHGIIRSIPKQHSAIENVRVSDTFSRQFAGTDLELKIGDADRFVSGQKVYVIEFDQQIFSSKNAFYYNLVGTEWGVPIHKVRFDVKMPAKVEDNMVGLSIGRYGTRGFDGGAEYSVQGTEIWGQTTQSLPANYGITLRAKVPDGYFADTQSKWVNLVWLGLLICTLFSFLTWYEYGKDEHVTPIVTFKSPENITPADAELILTEKISDKGLIALIVKLANDGYFKINSEKQKFTLSDFKDYAGSNRIERDLLDLLQKRAKDGAVTDADLKSSSLFYSGWNKLRENAVSKADKNKYYEKSSMNPIRNFMMILCMLGNIFLTIFAFINYRISPEMVVALFPVGFLLLWFVLAIKNANVILIIWGILVVMPIFVPLVENISPDNVSQVVMGIGCIISSMICYVQMLKPNVDGRLLKGKLLGLKHFIKVAEKKRLETMVEQNPQYFYKILPYAYVLGVSKVWMKQFEGIAVPPPVWAVDSGFRFNNFNGFARGFQAAVQPSVANGGIPQSSHSSSSGGGGFSGGGFGGGGGRSW